MDEHVFDPLHGVFEGEATSSYSVGDGSAFAVPMPGQPSVDLHNLPQGPVDVPGTTVPPLEQVDVASFHGVGTPFQDAGHWQPQHGEDCAVMAQGMIYESLTGQPLNEHAWTASAAQAGLYDPRTGTRPEAMGALLAERGIPVERSWGQGIGHLYDALADGRKVMVGLNAQDVHFPLREAATGVPIDQVGTFGHAVWVTGIGQQPDGSYVVLLCDSGTQTPLLACDLADFMNAWNDFDQLAVIAG